MDDENYKRKVALERAEILKDKVNDYIINKDKIPRGSKKQNKQCEITNSNN